LRIVEADGLPGAAAARGVAVIIDVLRAFTVSAYALAAGADECLLVTSVEEALDLQRRIPESVVSAEIDGLPVDGVPISNSPSQVMREGLRGRTLIQRSSDGTLGVAAARSADAVYASSLVVARATAERLLRQDPPLITLVAMGTPRGHEEDRICSRYLRALLEDCSPEAAVDLARWRGSEGARRLAAGGTPGFPPEDVELALRVDRFDFAMPVVREAALLSLRPDPIRAAGRSIPG
jgi:2-phosphosulfolactate phosphatase